MGLGAAAVDAVVAGRKDQRRLLRINKPTVLKRHLNTLVDQAGGVDSINDQTFLPLLLPVPTGHEFVQPESGRHGAVEGARRTLMKV